jgi:DNA-binding CsgD family transcriptional regulator
MASVTQAIKKSDIKFLGEVSSGTHVCLFYETQQDLLDTLIPFFKAGLESDEFCLWVISDPLTEKGAIDALKQSVPGIDGFLANGSLEILSGHDWYLERDRFDLKRITGGWEQKLRGALARGFRAMRISGNAFWLDTKHWEDFCAYERHLNESMGDQPMSVLCTYPLAASRPADILEVSSAHQFAIARRKGDWEVVKTVKGQALTHSLTSREQEVLTWVAKGKTAWETAQILHITKRTVNEHAQTIIRKLGAVNRTHAVAIALQNHIVKI